MGLDFMCLDARTAVGAAVAAIRDTDLAPEALQTIFTHDGNGRLNGAIRLARLLRHDDDVLLADVVESAPPHLNTDAEVADIAVIMSDYNLTMIPVVDHEDRVLGVVTVDDLLETLIPDEWKRRAEAIGEG
jgi:Mg/Co/Ni transporter MgtE